MFIPCINSAINIFMECFVDNSLCLLHIPIKCVNKAWLNMERTEPK